YGEHYCTWLVSLFDHRPTVLVRLPRRASEGQQALEQSPQHARLRCFTNDLLRYDLIDGQWVVTDLRLGLPGYHPFRFALAEQDEHGDVQLISSVEQWPMGRPPLEDLLALRDRAL